MSIEQNFPQVGGPVLDPRGNFTDEWLSFFRSLWNRTGQGPGGDPANLVLPALTAFPSASTANAAREAAQTAELLAATQPKPDFRKGVDEAKLFALSLARPAGNTYRLTVDEEGSAVDTAVTELNFTGAGVTATQTSPGVVQVDVPAGGGGTVTSVGLASANTDLTVGGATPITTSGAWTLTVNAAPKWSTARTLSFTGDATGSGSVDGSTNVATALTLANTAVTPGTYGDATHVSQFTVDAKGRLTFAQNVAISGGGGGSSWIPVVDGAEPPTFITDGAGHLALVAYP